MNSQLDKKLTKTTHHYKGKGSVRAAARRTYSPLSAAVEKRGLGDEWPRVWKKVRFYVHK